MKHNILSVFKKIQDRKKNQSAIKCLNIKIFQKCWGLLHGFQNRRGQKLWACWVEGAERMRIVCRECLDCVQLNMKHAEPGSPENVAGEDQLFPLLFSKYSDLKVSFYATKEIFSDQIWNSYLKFPKHLKCKKLELTFPLKYSRFFFFSETEKKSKHLK